MLNCKQQVHQVMELELLDMYAFLAQLLQHQMIM